MGNQETRRDGASSRGGRITMETQPTQALYALMTVVLFFKMSAISIVQGLNRQTAKAFVNPEDAKMFGLAAPAEREAPAVDRAARAWRNDLENIPIFLILGLVYVMLGGGSGAATIYFLVFT